MAVQIDPCKMTLEEDPILGWKLKMEGDCREEMRVLDELRPSKKRYLEKRIFKE